MEYIARPKKLYKEKIVPAMMEEFGYKSVMQVTYSNYWTKSSRNNL